MTDRAAPGARWIEAAALTLLAASVLNAAREAARILDPTAPLDGVAGAVAAVLGAGLLLLLLRLALYGRAVEPALPGDRAPPWTAEDGRFLLYGWAALAALVLAVYAPMLSGGAYVADDWHLAKNAARFLARARAGEWGSAVEEILRVSGLIRPTMYALYILEWRLFGANAEAGRLITLGYHLASAGGLLALALYLTRARWASLAAALLWAVHPLHVGTVAFIGARSEHAYLPFYAWAMVAYAVSMHGARPGRAYAAMLALLALALGANEIAVTFPFAALLLELFAAPRPRRESWKGSFGRLAGVGALLVAYMGVRLWRLGGGYGGHFFEHYFTAKTLEKTLYELPVFYFFPMSRAAVPDYFGWRSLALAGSLALVAWGLARRRVPAMMFFAPALALATVSVLLHEVGSAEALQDARYYYLSLWGVGLLFGFALFGGRDAGEPVWRRAAGALALAALLHACGWTTRRNLSLWLEAAETERAFHDAVARAFPEGFPEGGRQYFVTAPTRTGAPIPGTELNQWPAPCGLLFTTPGATPESLRIVVGAAYIGCAKGPETVAARLGDGRWGETDFAMRWDPEGRAFEDLTPALARSLAAPAAGAAPVAFDAAALAASWTLVEATGREEGGLWRLATEGWGTRLVSPPLGVAPEAYGRLAIEWSVEAEIPRSDRPFAVLRWTTRDAPEESEHFRRIDFPVPVGEGRRTTVVDLSESIEWRTGGPVETLRLTPVNYPGRVKVLRLALEPAP